MDTVHESPSAGAALRPDGTVDLNATARGLLESLLNAVMDEQASEMASQLGVARNGCRERGLDTCVGRLTLRVPKLREGAYFPEEVVSRWSRTDTALASAVCEMWARGVSTRKVEAVAAEMGLEGMGRSRVSRLCEALDSEVAALRSAPLGHVGWPYLWLDATYVPCREEGRPRRIAHLERNAADWCRRRADGAAAVAALKAAFAERDPALVRAGYARAVELLAACDERCASMLEDAEPAALAYLAFPREHGRWIRANNIQERMNAEIKRRSRVVQVFPSVESLVRLVGAVCCDQDDAWRAASNFMDRRSLADLSAAPLPEPEPGERERVLRTVEEGFDRKRRAA